MNFHEFLCIQDGCHNLQAIADDTGIGEKASDVLIAITGDPGGIKAMKSLTIIFTFIENSLPCKPGLCPLKDKELKENRIIVNRNPPLVVIIRIIRGSAPVHVQRFLGFHRSPSPVFF